jgi:phenylpropionate dioxygenase-like ring-hydroxylating dioxygenase large terminal subunit
MSYQERLGKFGVKDFRPEGWFWLMPSNELRAGQAKAVTFAGRDFAVFRTASGKVQALDAYCPHMGAHLGDGIVEGESLRCLFHNWKFAASGKCVEIPCQKTVAGVPPVARFEVLDRHGLIWLWTGAAGTQDALPVPPELKGVDVATSLGTPFVKNCHPNVVMINAIDAHHFNTVHKLVVNLKMQAEVQDARSIRFRNVNRVDEKSWFTRFISKFYAGALTYDMTYWYGHTGTVTLGPDFLHCYIMFTLRPTFDGHTEGQTVLFTRRRAGFAGAVVNRVLLAATRVVGNYFAKGDTVIFSKIKFNLRTPIAADQPILEFANHYEKQRAATIFEDSEGPIASSRPRREAEFRSNFEATT